MKPNPQAANLEYKPAFQERYSKLTDWKVFSEICKTFLRKSIRVNTLKTNIKELLPRLKNRFNLDPVPWCEEGYFIEHKEGRLDIGNTIEHTLGYYYVQEAASMIPPLVLDPQPGEHVLDMAAAPGSKTSQIAAMMKNKGVLVANDVAGDRLAALGINLQRTGCSNVLTNQSPGQNIKGVQFDKILLDAPCSGTGTIRKSLKTIKMWNPGMVKRITGLQKRLLVNAHKLLKDDGVLVYSTCSLEPEENEGIITYAVEELGMKVLPIKLKIKRSDPVMEFEGEKYSEQVKNCLRIWPQDNDTEGFFVTKLVK
jgi:NOL1/NOP2/sun family putative RNA methylase